MNLRDHIYPIVIEKQIMLSSSEHVSSLINTLNANTKNAVKKT